MSVFRQEAFITFCGLVKITLTKYGFFRTPRSISNWTKHGQTSLLIAGHDPPVDITIYMDVSLNPGPDSVVSNHDHINTGSSLSSNKNSLKCGLLNTRSVRNKLTDFQVLLASNDLDLFAVTESWLSSVDSPATDKLTGISDVELLADLPYTCYRTDRTDGRKGGGVLLVIKNSCMASRRCDLERVNIEKQH